jgi:hypothetical protein
MKISVLGSKKTLHIVRSLLHSQPTCGIVGTTSKLFLLDLLGLPQREPIFGNSKIENFFEKN